MPNIEDRRDHEQQLMLAIVPALLRQRERVLGTPLGRDPVADFQREMRSALEDRLSTIYMLSATQLVNMASEQIPDDTQKPVGFSFWTEAKKWAAGLLALLLPELIKISAERISLARKAAARDMKELAGLSELDQSTRNEIQRRLLRARIEDVFGQERAEMIAITEVTRANTAGERGAIQRIGQHTPVVALATWRTQRDERVCPICGPNDEKPESYWRKDYPLGPASTHPRCRCDLIWKFYPRDHPESKKAGFAYQNVSPLPGFNNAPV